MFTGNFKTIQNVIIYCILLYIDKYAKEEIKECKLFSTEMDDSTDTVQKYQFNIVIM